jgi:hypothetical protein
MIIQIKNITGRLIISSIAFIFAWLMLALIKSDFDGVGIIWQTAMIPATAIGYLYLFIQKGDYNLYKNCLILALVIILPFAIVTLLAETGASRTLSGNAKTLEQLAVAYENRIKGVLDYGAIHAMPFLILGLYVAYRQQRNKVIKTIMLCFTLLFIAVVLKSIFFAAIVVTSCLLFFSSGEIRNMKIRCIVFFVLIFVVSFLWSSGAILYIINGVVNLVFGAETDNIATIKTGQITNFYYSGAGFEGRQMRYEVAIDGFLNNIFIGGINENEDAGHSFVLQILGDLGLIGFSIYTCFFISLFKMVFQILPRRLHWYYYMVIFGFVTLALIKSIAINIEALVVFGLAPMFMLMRKEDFYYAMSNARVRM